MSHHSKEAPVVTESLVAGLNTALKLSASSLGEVLVTPLHLGERLCVAGYDDVDIETELAGFLRGVKDARDLAVKRGRQQAELKVWIPQLLQRGMSLMSQLGAQLESQFDDRIQVAASTPSGDGFISSANFGDLQSLVRNLRRVLAGLDQLTAVVKKRSPVDIRADLERVLREDAATLQVLEHHNWIQVCEVLWRTWVIGHRIPGECVSWSEADAGTFGPRFFMGWTEYLTSACRYRRNKSGKPIARSTAIKHFNSVWPEVLERTPKWLEQKSYDKSCEDWFVTRPTAGRHAAPKRDDLSEADVATLRDWFLTKRRVRVWKCTGGCDEATLALSPTPPAECLKSRAYVCPRWYSCGGVLFPHFDPVG